VGFRFYSDIPKYFSIAIRILEKSVTVKQLIQLGIKKSKKEGIKEERKGIKWGKLSCVYADNFDCYFYVPVVEDENISGVDTF